MTDRSAGSSRSNISVNDPREKTGQSLITIERDYSKRSYPGRTPTSFQARLPLGSLLSSTKSFRQPPSPGLLAPRRRLSKLFSATADDTGPEEPRLLSAQSERASNPSRGGGLPIGYTAFSSISNTSTTRSSTGSSLFNGVLAGLNPGDLVRNVTVAEDSTRSLFSSGKKRKLDLSSSVDGGHNSSAYFSPNSADTSRLETDIKRLEFERDSARKLVEMERLQIDEELRQRRLEEQENNKKTADMWSQAEKIIAENDRLRASVEKKDTELIEMRKKYEEQIASLQTGRMEKERQLDANVRELRLESIAINEKLRSVTRERAALSEENAVLQKRLASADQLAAERAEMKHEVQSLKSELQIKEGQLADALKANTLASNLPDELKQYRDLQASVPLLQKENLKLREKAALARANEDKIASLQETITRYEQRQARFYDLELENEHLKNRLGELETDDISLTPTKKPVGVQSLINKVTQLESSHKALTEDLSLKNQCVSALTAEKRSLSQQLAELKSEYSLSESQRLAAEQTLQDTSARLITVQSERDTLKLIKETIDSSTSRRDPVVQAKLRDLEERAVRYQALATDFEQRYQKAEKIEKELRSQIASLERQRTTQVSQSSPSQDVNVQRARGAYNPAEVQILSFVRNPADEEDKAYRAETERIREENKMLLEKLNQVKTAGSYPSDLTMRTEEFLQGPGEAMEELKKQVEKLEKARKADMNDFKKTSSSFRQVCKELLGWKLRVEANKAVLHVAEGSASDAVVFEREDETKPWELKANSFTNTHSAFVTEYLNSHHSPPGFFARIILHILSERTLLCLT
ncbi:hypothetical protein RvY_13055 [Ramazzottius varieornatus]|uniref:Spindle assembly checkpoint component MAD1 n=1 Tax=Ramazzottius varieornatus TaxID=947166 RepID=A0A1D1VNT8_RAMVA|nr:hypothetical protein RvY_13055 [Ramazzottius varieornatus]